MKKQSGFPATRRRAIVITFLNKLTLPRRLVSIFCCFFLFVWNFNRITSWHDLFAKKAHQGHAKSSSVIIHRGNGRYKLKSWPPDPINSPNHWSQAGQDEWIDRYYNRTFGKTFVEIGAFDGESHSNTLFLEKYRSWKGVLIEANPYSYEAMKDLDRNSWMVNSCISGSSPNSSKKNFFIAGGLTSAIDSVSTSHMNRIHLDKARYGRTRQWKGVGENKTVPCASLSEILGLTKGEVGKQIDYFSLDVEGGEMNILESIDFEDINIQVFSIELQEHAEDIRRFMNSKGYEEVAMKQNDGMFMKKDENAD